MSALHQDEIMPGLRELSTMIRYIAGGVALFALAIIGGGLQCAAARDARDQRLEAEREAQAQVADGYWQRIIANRIRREAVTKALQDSLAAVRSSAPAVARAIAHADSARRTIAIGTDTTVAGDTTRYVNVRRTGGDQVYRAPAFLVNALALSAVALDSSVRQMTRLSNTIAAARQRIALDSVDRATGDSLVAVLRDEIKTADQQRAGAEQRGYTRGRARGYKLGVITTTIVAIIVRVVLW